MSPDLNALHRLVHTDLDTRLFNILSKIYNSGRRTRTRERACNELFIFLSSLPEFRTSSTKNRQIDSLADEAHGSADILDNLWEWFFGEGKDGVPRIEKFSPSNEDQGLLENILIWLRVKRHKLKLENYRKYCKQSQILPSDAPKNVGDHEAVTFLDSFAATPTAKWRKFLDACYYDEDDSLKQPFSKKFPTFNCHVYLMIVEFREPRPVNVEEVAEVLAQEHKLNIPTDTIGRLARENFVPLLRQKYQDFLDNDGELITN
jgi:hypothetical protein